MYCSQLELFSCPTEKREATPKLKLPAFLANEAKDCEFLVLWLDCDKEGENICFEVMEAVRHQININSPKVSAIILTVNKIKDDELKKNTQITNSTGSIPT